MILCTRNSPPASDIEVNRSFTAFANPAVLSRAGRQPQVCQQSASPGRPLLADVRMADDGPVVATENALPLLSQIRKERRRVNANFFCPGHKQGAGASADLRDCLGPDALENDLPELPELDNLFAPEGAIKEAQDMATRAFIGDSAVLDGWSTFFLANGSTSGVEAAVLSCVRPGRGVILPRNVHQCAIHALVLSGAVPFWVDPEYDSERDLLHGVLVDSVAKVLNDNARAIDAILIVSPTYHGVLSDVSSLASLAHEYHIPLIVDEAHGAHFAFHEALPTPAAKCGADIVVQSTHKTLGALTQSAMIHVRTSEYVTKHRVASSLQLLQSSSPSYLLLASLDAAREDMTIRGRRMLQSTVELANFARQQIRSLPGFAVLDETHVPRSRGTQSDSPWLDTTRVTVLLAPHISGYDLDEHLIDNFGVYAELPAFRHVTLVFTIGNTTKEVDILIKALSAFDASPHAERSETQFPGFAFEGASDVVMTPRDAFFQETDIVAANDAPGRVSADTLCPYPPGIPVLVPGERISKRALDRLNMVVQSGGTVSGAHDGSLEFFRVIRS